jgi:hypothetical protein
VGRIGAWSRKLHAPSSEELWNRARHYCSFSVPCSVRLALVYKHWSGPRRQASAAAGTAPAPCHAVAIVLSGIGPAAFLRKHNASNCRRLGLGPTRSAPAPRRRATAAAGMPETVFGDSGGVVPAGSAGRSTRRPVAPCYGSSCRRAVALPRAAGPSRQ